MARMAAGLNAGWRAMTARGFGELSPPEAHYAMLELPTNRTEYVGVLQDLGDYPARSPIGQRTPSSEDVATLKQAGGRWRGVTLLDDERTLKHAALLFERLYVLDPFYDSGAQLYAAWHDPFVKDEHSRRLAEQAGWLVRLAPLLNTGTAILAPDHLPGSWNPRPGWRRPRPDADRRQLAAWAMRSGLVLLYWADRLDAVVCTSRADVLASLAVALGAAARSTGVDLTEWPALEVAVLAREERAVELCDIWTELRRVSRRRGRHCLDDLAYALGRVPSGDRGTAWRLVLGETSV